MGFCPNCGSWVDEGDTCGCCGGSGSYSYGNDDENYYGGSSQSDYGYSSDFDRTQQNKRHLRSLKSMYEYDINRARIEKNGVVRLRCYMEAVGNAERYWRESRKCGCTVDGMPEMSNILSEEDVNWIVKRHYENRYKLHIFSRDEKEDLEKILKATGKLDKIRENEEAHRKLHEEFLKKQAIVHTIQLREDYFECLEKANDFAAKDKPLHAVKEYGKAVRNYEEYFKSDYSKDERKNQMPERKLTPKAVDNIMIIYKKYHPLLKSNRTNNRINEEILELLDGEWNDRLEEADLEVQEILRQKQIEKQKKKEKMIDTAADVVVGARIAGDKIRGIFRK